MTSFEMYVWKSPLNPKMDIWFLKNVIHVTTWTIDFNIIIIFFLQFEFKKYSNNSKA